MDNWRETGRDARELCMPLKAILHLKYPDILVGSKEKQGETKRNEERQGEMRRDGQKCWRVRSAPYSNPTPQIPRYIG